MSSISEVEVRLNYPIEFNGQAISVVRMRRCKVKDRRAAAKQWKTPEEQEIGLIANLCDLPPGAIDELDSVDYNKIQEHLRDFFGLNIPA